MTSARVMAALVIASCMSCGEPAAAVRSGADPSGADAPRRGVAAIAFEAKKAGSKAFPFPFVEGKVGDQPARFILDTGASAHAIDRSLGGAQVSIDGFGALPQAPITPVDLSPALRAHGISGILSPQLLAERDQALVLDLVNRQLRSRPKSTAWSELADLGALLTPPAAQRLCAVDAGRLLALDATVEGEATRLVVDTGASRTLLLEGTKAGTRATGHPVLGRSVVQGVAGDVATSLHGGVPMTIGAWSGTTDVGMAAGARHPQCGHEGRLGIDVLQNCAIAVTAEEAVVACRVLK